MRKTKSQGKKKGEIVPWLETQGPSLQAHQQELTCEQLLGGSDPHTTFNKRTIRKRCKSKEQMNSHLTEGEPNKHANRLQKEYPLAEDNQELRSYH